MNQDLIVRVQEVIDAEIKPMIERDGGSIELVSIDETGIVKVRLSGACSKCSASSITLHGGIERILRKRFPEIQSAALA
ncbi:MAG: NifU family protein [Ignavibacteriae bacterium]|jgi:Fe-S cluster biogenesis protein NfuA|nr:NifU family protein [Ignavibacteriota bacterium]